MTQNEIKAEIRHRTAALILPNLIDAGAIKIEADKTYAIPHTVDGEIYYTEITITAKRADYVPREKVKKAQPSFVFFM